MKPHKVIDNYCSLYGITMPVIDFSVPRFFVTLSPGGAGVLYMREKRSELVGKVVSSAMKRGAVLYINNGHVSLLEWDNWKRLWAKLFSPGKCDKTPEPNISPGPYQSEIFAIMKGRRPVPKPQKHGFKRTESANRSMYLLGTPM